MLERRYEHDVRETNRWRCSVPRRHVGKKAQRLGNRSSPKERRDKCRLAADGNRHGGCDADNDERSDDPVADAAARHADRMRKLRKKVSLSAPAPCTMT